HLHAVEPVAPHRGTRHAEDQRVGFELDMRSRWSVRHRIPIQRSTAHYEILAAHSRKRSTDRTQVTFGWASPSMTWPWTAGPAPARAPASFAAGAGGSPAAAGSCPAWAGTPPAADPA